MFTPNRRFFACVALTSLAFCGYGERSASAGPLTRAATSDDADVTGMAWTQARTDGDHLLVSALHVAPDRALVAVVIDGNGHESSLGGRSVWSDGSAFWTIDTALGGTLPCGASTIGALVGYQVVVRDASDATIVLLVGTLPAPVSSIVDQDGREGIPRAAAPSGSDAHVRIAHRTGTAGRELFGVDVAGLAEETVVNVWLEVPGSSGTFSLVGTLTTDEDGAGALELSTGDAETLPFGVVAAAELVGLRIELRSSTNAVLFEGAVPVMTSN